MSYYNFKHYNLEPSNVTDQQKVEQVVNNPIREQFKKLLKSWNFSLPAKKFSLQYYIRHGFKVEQDINIHFINSDFKKGILKNEDQTEYWVYHQGTIHKKDEYSDEEHSLHFCPYAFTEGDSTQHLKFLEHDVIFEDYVHKGFGFFINNEEIEKLFSQRKWKNQIFRIPGKRKNNNV